MELTNSSISRKSPEISWSEGSASKNVLSSAVYLRRGSLAELRAVLTHEKLRSLYALLPARHQRKCTSKLFETHVDVGH